MSRSARSHYVGGLLLFGGIAILLVPGHRSLMAQVQKKAKPAAGAKTPLEGAWRLVSARNPATGQQRGAASDHRNDEARCRRTLHLERGAEWQSHGGAGGKYAIDGDSYTETVIYTVGADQRSTEFLVGKSFTFTWKLVDGKWLHKGMMKLGASEQQIDEVWEPIP